MSSSSPFATTAAAVSAAAGVLDNDSSDSHSVPFFRSSVDYLNWNQQPTKLEALESQIRSLLLAISSDSHSFSRLSLKKPILVQQLIHADDQFIMSDLRSENLIERDYYSVCSNNLRQKFDRLNDKMQFLEYNMNWNYEKLSRCIIEKAILLREIKRVN